MAGIVLEDAHTKATYRSLEKEVTLESQPYQDGYEDFLQRPYSSTVMSLIPYSHPCWKT